MPDWFLCMTGSCRRVLLFETDAGVGSKCIRCGEIHDWMTWEELRQAKTRIDAQDPTKAITPVGVEAVVTDLRIDPSYKEKFSTALESMVHMMDILEADSCMYDHLAEKPKPKTLGDIVREARRGEVGYE